MTCFLFWTLLTSHRCHTIFHVSAQLLRTLFNKGVELRSRPDLHAKVGVFRQDVDHWTRFYVVEPEECRGLSWNRFKKEVKKQGISRISQNSIRELNPREVLLLEEFWK